MKINKKLLEKYPWKMRWAKRTKIIASAIPEGSSVLDLGGGFGNLFRHLKGCRYRSLDVDKWTDMTTVADFNKGEFPDTGKWEFLVCQGVLEYLDNPEEFLKTIRKYGKILLLTYWFGKSLDERIKDRMEEGEFRKILEKAGWKVIFEKNVTGAQKLFYCSKT